MHLPLLRLPYFWDEAGYYIPAALDFYHSWSLIPATTLPEGHSPLVMIYLGLTWRLFGYSPLATRLAMTAIAAATLTSLFVLARRIANREIALWSALLLGLSPLFFAQTTLAHLDLAAALFTTLSVLYLLVDRYWLFALAASLAVLSKETAVVLLPVVWVYAWRKRRGFGAEHEDHSPPWIPLVAPLFPLAAWALFYHHRTGYWTGNRGYLIYNLYSTLSPMRVFWSLLRRIYELFFSGSKWLLTASASLSLWFGRGQRPAHSEPRGGNTVWRRFVFLAAGLVGVYVLLLSVVGGAILPRYLLPILPVFYLFVVIMVGRLPRFSSRMIMAAAAACFVGAWFINPPYPFPLEDNLAYADFVHLHQEAAQFLHEQPGRPRILTAWPATDELTRPFLGYVGHPLCVVPVEGFSPPDFANLRAPSFDLLYFYSRRWEPPGNWISRFPIWLRLQGRYFDYQPQIDAQVLAARYHLRLVKEWHRRGQWVKIYSH